MGSWDGTCAVTNLPIKAGTKVVLFILEKQHDMNVIFEEVGGGCVDANIFFEPIPYPIVGTYDDYGTLEDIETNLDILDNYMKYKYDIEKGTDYIRDIERCEHTKLFSLMIIKDVYDKIIEANSNKNIPYTTDGLLLKEWFNKKLEKAIEDARKDKEIFGDLIKDTLPSDIFNHVYYSFRFMDYHSRSIGVEELVEDNNETVRKNYLNTNIMLRVFNECRRLWIPPSGAGGNQEYYDNYKLITDFTSTHLDELIATKYTGDEE